MNSPPRKKPGPKPLPFLDGMRPRTVYLDDDTITMAKVLGNGNVSAGLREAVRTEFKRYQKG